MGVSSSKGHRGEEEGIEKGRKKNRRIERDKLADSGK